MQICYLRHTFLYQTYNHYIVLRLVRTNQPLVILFLLLYAFIVRSYVFTHPTNWTPSNSGMVSNYIYQWMGYDGFWSNIAALLLVVIQAIVVNSIVNRYKMGKETSYFPALSYILVCSAIPDFLHLSPVTLANTFYIIAISEMFRWYRKPDASAQIFNVGFWLAIGSMFYFSVGAFFILGVVALFQLRAFRVNELVILSIGLLIPYFFVGVYQFWFGGLEVFMSKYVWGNFSFFDWQIEWVSYNYLKIFFFAGLVIWVVTQFQNYFFKTNIQTQKNVVVLMWALPIALFPAIFQTHMGLDHLLLLGVPLSIFIAFNLLNIENRMRAEIIHASLFILVLAFHHRDVVIDIFFIK